MESETFAGRVPVTPCESVTMLADLTRKTVAGSSDVLKTAQSYEFLFTHVRQMVKPSQKSH